MKHGISPTTPRNATYGKWAHISMPLAFRCEDMRSEEGRVIAFLPQMEEMTHMQSVINRIRILEAAAFAPRIRYLPVNQKPEEWEHATLVKAPMKGITYKRQELKLTRPGLRRRALARGEELTPERLAERRAN